MVPAVPAVVPAALPGTCPRHIFLMGTFAPGTSDSLWYLGQMSAVPGAACGTGRVELSSTF